MPFLILITAPQSLVNEIFLAERVKYFTQNKQDWELHTISRKVTCKMICSLHDKVVVHKTDFFAWGKDAVGKAYDEIIEHADAAIIFWDGEAWHEKELIRKCIERPVKHVVVKYESLKQELERTKPEKKAGRKKITVALSDYARQRYKEAHKNWFIKKHPHGWKDGFYSGPKMPVIDSGSKASGMIVKFLDWEGWDATVVSTTGRQLPDGTWIKGTTKLGSQDVFATVNGKSCRFEVKHNTDTPKQKQLDRQAKTREAKGVSEFIYTKDFDYFFHVYDKILNNEL